MKILLWFGFGIYIFIFLFGLFVSSIMIHELTHARQLNYEFDQICFFGYLKSDPAIGWVGSFTEPKMSIFKMETIALATQFSWLVLGLYLLIKYDFVIYYIRKNIKTQ